MKDLFEVLRQKEKQLQQLQEEINTLKTAARLLAEEGDHSSKSASALSVATPQESVMAAVPMQTTRPKGGPQLRSDKAPVQFP
jgi:regulator of replication initiation timing